MDGADGTLHDLIEIDRPVLDDTTGGALVDADGQVLGICLQGKTTALGYAVPIDLARKVGNEIRTKADGCSWGRLGVKAADLDPGQAQDLGISGAAQVVSVEPASPAAKAGLVTGDLITRLGMTKIESVTDLVAALSEHHPGDELVVEYRRGIDVAVGLHDPRHELTDRHRGPSAAVGRLRRRSTATTPTTVATSAAPAPPSASSWRRRGLIVASGPAA